ncbi:MAG: cobalamin-independent methionine synthase II family protein [Burkholderiales bacterium]|nr:cobalamin-independent methionine synthase II family protein [Burkholderiales bacterium]
MLRSESRILTTHVGRLERPAELTALMERHPRGRPAGAAFGGKLREAVDEVVRRQAQAGVDIVNDGEFGKLSWNLYINGRLAGHEHVPAKAGEPPRHSRERGLFREFYAELEKGGAHYWKSPGNEVPPGMRWACTGPVSYIGQRALAQDLEALRAALGAAGVEEAFMTATSPIRPRLNEYYATEEDYCQAVGEAMREEYRAIVDAGFVLQIDDPHLPDLWTSYIGNASVEDYRSIAARRIELVNHALRGIPEDRVRYHICWGSWHGPHVDDLPLANIVDLLLKVRVQAISFEAANPRHEHEWEIWRSVKLPAGKILMPGVISHATNTVEHPELVARRIRNFAGVVGRENVIAATDCGMGYRVHSQIGWAKLGALAEGARLASKALWT